MPNKSSLRVSNAPPKPLLIWDGECDFCRLWIERWREITAGKVDYATYEGAAERFPEIPVDQFTRAMAFIKPDGDVFFAADAVYRSLAYRHSQRWLAWSYDRVPGFAAVSETGYGFIARRRINFCRQFAHKPDQALTFFSPPSAGSVRATHSFIFFAVAAFCFHYC